MTNALHQHLVVVAGYDQDRWAGRLGYDEAPVETALEYVVCFDDPICCAVVS